MKFIKENFDKSVERERKIARFLESKEEKKSSIGKNDSVRKWYEREFSDDAVSVEDVDPNITFEMAASHITPKGGEDRFYDYMGVHDSFVREQVFRKIAEIFGVSYDDVYDTWMGEPFTKLKDKLLQDNPKLSLDEGVSSTEKVKSILNNLLASNGKELRAFGKDEKMPSGFRFKSSTGRNGEVSYNGTDYAFAVVDGKVRVMPSSAAGWNWSETLYNDKLFESKEDDNVYRVTYKASDTIFSSFMVKAKDEDEAIDKAMKYRQKKYGKDTDIVGAEKMSASEVEDFKRRGMSLIEGMDEPTDITELEKATDTAYKKMKSFKRGSKNYNDAFDEWSKLHAKLTKAMFAGNTVSKKAPKDVSLDDTLHEDMEETEEIPASPETMDAMSVANTLNALIQDEWQAIDGYNSTISTYRSMMQDNYPGKDKSIDYTAIIKILQDIAQEEMNHVGMLQKAMGTISPNVSEIKGGEEEAEETLENPNAVEVVGGEEAE